MTTADLHLRVSLDRDGATSIQRQEAQCRRWCDEHYLTVRLVHNDNGRSGFDARVHRDGFDAALAAVTSGEVAILVVWKLDRLSRHGIGQVGGVLDELERVAGRLVSVKDGLDTAQPHSRVVFALLSEFARAESENIGVRVRSAKEAHRDQGRWLGGWPPYGYELDSDYRLRLAEPQCTVMRGIVADVVAGVSLSTICRELNMRGVTNSRGRIWRTSASSDALGTPALAGLMPARHVRPDGLRSSGHPPVHRHSETGVEVSCLAPGSDAVVTRAVQHAMREALQDRLGRYGRGRSQTATRPPSALLSRGLGRCVGCGRGLTLFGRSYRCRAVTEDPDFRCSAPASAAQQSVDATLTVRWLHRVSDPGTSEGLRRAIAPLWISKPAIPSNARWLEASCMVADLRAGLADADHARFVVGDLDAARHAAVTAAITDRLAFFNTRLEGMDAPLVDLTPMLDSAWVQTRWCAASNHERRLLLRTTITTVSVAKATARGGRFDPARVQLTWRPDADLARTHLSWAESPIRRASPPGRVVGGRATAGA